MNANKILIKCSLGLAIILSLSLTTSAQDEGFIYGKVTTIDDNTYTGQIRWGKEEAFWTDMFNAGKRFNDNLQYLSQEERDHLEEYRHQRSHNWYEFNIRFGERDFTHQFTTQFGNIKALYFTGRERVDVELKNGEKIEVLGEGYNDIGGKIRVFDVELGKVELRWSRIDKIEFSPTPSTLKEKFGDPLYGTVKTYNGDFTGFIQWDHDERISTDKLDGDTRDGDLSIEFGKIKSIEREGGGSNVVLKSGRELYLRGSNDVNGENRGIIVTDNKFGRVDIPWREFKMATFEDNAPNSGPSYNNFGAPKELKGTIKTTSGTSLSGRIIFDLDEALDTEVLQGNDDELEYIIPFKNIKRIAPKSYSYSNVELKNGLKFLLGESQDTDERNDGVLVFKGSKDPEYVRWEDIDEIIFD